MNAPAAVFEGGTKNASLFAVPALMLKLGLVAVIDPVLVAARVYPLPALSIARLPKVATPLTAFTVVLPLSVPALGLVPIAMVTDAVFPEIALPLLSATFTVTAGVIGEPAVVLEG